ncbi:MAG: hypothetical protein WAM00_03995 [Salegentibacter sp.]
MPYQFRRKARPGEKRDAILAEVKNPERIRQNRNFKNKDPLIYFICEVDAKGEIISGSEEALQRKQDYVNAAL